MDGSAEPNLKQKKCQYLSVKLLSQRRLMQISPYLQSNEYIMVYYHQIKVIQL